VNPKRITGVLSPVVTPFKPDLSPDADKFVRQCRWLLSQNVGLAVFGTNSEANSLSTEEKIELLDRLIAADVDPARMMPGTGCCAITDSVRLTRHAVKLGCGGVLMLPPFYYKGVSDEGLYRSFVEIIERVGEARLRVYHDRLVEAVAKAPNRVSLAALIPPLFQTVLERGGGGGEAAGEADDDAHSSKPTSLIFELHGSQFQFRPADRANKKFKLKPMDYR